MRLFSKDPFVGRHASSHGLTNWIFKVLQDYLLSFLFSSVLLYGVRCAFPQLSQWVHLPSLIGYAALFTLGWNLLFSNSLAIMISFLVLFLSGIAGALIIFTSSTVLSRIGDYLHWLTSFFLSADNPSGSYSRVTVLLLTMICCFLVSLLVSRVSGNIIFFLLALSVATLFDFSGKTLPVFFKLIFLFGLFFHYIRMRHSIYLDHRLAQTDTPLYGNRPNDLTLPACFLVLIAVTVAYLLPDGILLSSEIIRNTGKSLTSFIVKTEKDFFKSREDVAYDVLPVGYDDGMGPVFDQSEVTTFKVTSYLESTDYVYLRSHASRSYRNGWISEQLTPIEATDPVSPFTMSQSEISLTRELLESRAKKSSDKHPAEAGLLELLKTADISIVYDSIKTSWVFELPMATSYSAFDGISLKIVDDLGGSGLFSSKLLTAGANYTVTYLSPTKNDATISVYRYFGSGFYASLTAAERESIYGERFESFRLRSENIVSLFADSSTLSPELLSLGNELTQKSTTTIDRALDIADYLLSEFSYNPDCTLSGGDGDYVSDFLFSSRSGGESHFASAAVLLLRAAGIPARYCEGYLVLAGGDLGEVEVHQKDAHAWAELYLEGLGWIPLEVTPTRGTSATDLRSPTYHAPVSSPSRLSSISREDLGNWFFEFLRIIGIGLLHLFQLLFVFILALLSLSLLHRSVLFLSGGLWGIKATVAYLSRLFRLAGYPRMKTEGLLTYTQRLDGVLPPRLRLSSSVVSLYAHTYGGEVLDRAALVQLKSWIFLFPIGAKALRVPLRRRILLFFLL